MLGPPRLLMHVICLKRMTYTLPAVPPRIWRSHIPGGIAFHSKTGGGGGPIRLSLRGPPTEAGKASGPLDDVSENIEAWDGSVPGPEIISVGQCWIHWMGEYLKCLDTTIR